MNWKKNIKDLLFCTMELDESTHHPSQWWNCTITGPRTHTYLVRWTNNGAFGTRAQVPKARSPSRLMRRLHDPTGWTNCRANYRPDSWTSVYTVKLLIQLVGTIVEWTFTRSNRLDQLSGQLSARQLDERPSMWQSTGYSASGYL